MPVIGDPAGMLAAAAQLRFRAEQLTRLAGDVDAHATSMTFRGPAADRWRVAVTEQSVRLRAASGRIGVAADALVRDAARVEEERRIELLTGGV